jgi:hypothetical protein
LVVKFWDDVKKWIKEKVNIHVNWEKDNLLFGVNVKCMDLIMLICRFHIYKMKMKGNKPSIHVLKKDIKDYYSLEKYIYLCQNNIAKFYKKWGVFKVLCTL